MSNQKVLLEVLKKQGITHPRVRDALKKVPRENFVLAHHADRAYENTALPITCQQTISQPYIVALMTQTLVEQFPQAQKILEIGTGSGYQCAILAHIFKQIWTIERIPSLLVNAKKTLLELRYQNIHFKLGDGALGWPAAAPFDAIMVTAAAREIPLALIEQLQPNGIMIIPIGAANKVQQLMLIKKQDGFLQQTIIENVSFVPLIDDN